MPERPLILFPTPERADRDQSVNKFVPTQIHMPTVSRQSVRLQPQLDTLRHAFETKALKVQESPMGINPDFALVFEIIGSVDEFYTAVKHTDGLEWIFDRENDGLEPDEDFYQVDEKTEENDMGYLNGKVYCVMSNQQAMEQLLNLWHKYQNGEDVFPRGLAGIRNIFTHIKNIRKWNAQDRISETHVMDYWRESLDIDGNNPVPFEIELFYRSDDKKRRIAVETIKHEIDALGGRLIQECIINEICYHGLLVELPRIFIESLVYKYEDIELSQVDEIMFFRPTCQASFDSVKNTKIYNTKTNFENLPNGDAVVAVFDGMPLQNHQLLRNRVIIDDPDDFASMYEGKNRVHGTSMVSQVIYGDINKNDTPIKTPVYVHPVLQPKEVDSNKVLECVPDDCLFIDVLHRAIKRMVEGEGNDKASSPNTKVINLSVGDPVRQFTVTMSPIARLLDYFAYKYNLLFIVSAGNHPEILDYVDIPFDTLKTYDINQRSKEFGSVINKNQWRLRMLSPAEGINSLTVGALYDDYTHAEDIENCILAVDKGLPSPASAVGKGYQLTIAPDLFYNGGRGYIRKKFDGSMAWVESSYKVGCLSASPYGYSNEDSGCAYSFGTSNAAAQITHEAAKCYEVLNQIFLDETGEAVPVDSIAILLKAMLTHGASWEPVADELAAIMDTPSKRLSKWLGNGIPDINRVKECTKNRITLIGFGALKKDEADIYRLPVPIDFSSQLIARKLTITLAYFTPIIPNRQSYRGAKLWFDINEDAQKLVPSRANTDWREVQRGTLQHEIFVGGQTLVWDNRDILIKVNCKENAGKIKKAIPYCIFVSFEISEAYDIDLYSDVLAKIYPRVSITPDDTID